MSFPANVKEKVLVACARHCCLCRKFAGLKIEIHHIQEKADGGEDTFENAIPLCFDCHADMRSYDHKHPKGTKYTREELVKHRDNWYRQVEAWPFREDVNSETVAPIVFVITPIDHQCHWGISKQQDGSFVTQISCHFLVSNRTKEPLYLIKANLILPEIAGEILPGLLTMRSPNSPMHGTAHVSGHFIPSYATLPVALTMLIRGVPEQSSGDMDSTIEIIDANSNKERVQLKLKSFNGTR